MEFDTHQVVFSKDIDSSLLLVESEADFSDLSGKYFGTESTGHLSRCRNDDFCIDKPYTGSRPWGNDYPDYGRRIQNSRPVAGQFKADVNPKITNAHKAEKAVDPFSPSFRQLLSANRANMHKVSNGGEQTMTIQQKVT